ncbi:hypothetical protein [Enterovibrio norvegicus]|uniref:hypothetical protein n=1 Tax=Enterovibrio norvegicus TaxID=188144 RepID=UPI000C862ACD|nr:hypothetical protein [Enterovibrio norvegicus]PMN71093.1 hypothetical protein BCT27_17390 [Enterovibrio norvegicus]
MSFISNVLIVNYYGENGNNPGGKRSLLWKEFFKDHNVDISSPKSGKNKGLFQKVFHRLINFALGHYPQLPQDWVVEVSEAINSGKYDVVVLCCPDYSVCEFVSKNTRSKIVLDIRDGIYFESLWSRMERWRYKNKLLSLEDKIKDVYLLSTNIPGLKKHYESKYKIPMYLLLNISVFDSQIYSIKRNLSNKSELRLLYAGGLLKSSIGQNLLCLCRSIKMLNEKGERITLTMLGRFNAIERIFYTKLFKFVEIREEVPSGDLSKISEDFDCFVISNTTNRDLLPSKFWFYIKSNLPILSISPSYSLDYVSQSIEGLICTSRDSEDIAAKIKQILALEDFDRFELNINDEKEELKSRLGLI